LDTVWVTCEGENPADRENIGPVEYYASGITDRQFPGIPGYFFPYSKQDNYKAPFVFVKFTKPQSES
jgi:sodium/potassium-transporting ATPase subunit beta